MAVQRRNLIAIMFLCILLTSCFTYRPFTNTSRGKAMNGDAIQATVKPGFKYRIKLVDSREVMIIVRTINEKQITGDLAISDYTGDNFRHAAFKPGGVILLSNISEIQKKHFSIRNTLILVGTCVAIYLVSDYGISTSYK